MAAGMESRSVDEFHKLLLTGNESQFRAQLEAEVTACMNRLIAENTKAGHDIHYHIARAALHYDCPSFAQWLRVTWTNRSPDLDYQPFAREGYVSKSHWERSYNNVQPGINWFTTFSSEKPLRVVFEGDPSSITSDVDSLLFVVSAAERDLLRDFLHKVDLIEWYDHLQATLYEGTIVDDPALKRYFESPCDQRDAIIQAISDFADRLDSLRIQMRWEQYPASPPSDAEPSGYTGSLKALKTAYLISFLYTWYPNITATVTKEYDSCHGLALGLRVPQESNPELINARISAIAMLDPLQYSRADDVDRVTHDIEQQLRGSLESVVQQLCSIELKTITRKPPAVSLDLERTIRALANPTKPASRAHDTWFQWREKFPRTRQSTARRRDVPLWGKSESMSALFAALRNKVASHRGGVDTIFLYSPPGCGKEIIAKLCHFMSSSATDYAGIVQSGKSRLKECGAWEDQVKVALSRAIGRLNLSWKRDASGQEFAPIGGQLPEMWDEFLTAPHATEFSAWDFNYFTIQGAEISAPSGDTKQLLIGTLGKDVTPERIGYLVRASFTHGTVFLDELNTMHPKDANLFLRLTEKPFKVNIDGYRGQFPLDVRIVFASNKKPEELIAMGWNEAVITRIAKPGSYFEIPPLRDRKEDIAVLASFLLLDEKMKQKKNEPQLTSPPVAFDYDALRFLCETGWESGNYRDLISVWHQLLNRRGWMHLDPLIRLTEIQECIDEVRLGRQVRHHEPKPAQR